MLPAALIIVNAVVTGSYAESPDDPIMILMMRGLLAGVPTGTLHVGLFGVGHVLKMMYQVAGGTPWFALLLYGSLYLAMVLHFTLIQRLARRLLNNAQIIVLLSALFIAAWSEHILWFSYTRVPVVLAAGAFLSYAFDAKESGIAHLQRVGLLMASYLLALCIFPGGGLLGIALALPAAVRVPDQKGLDFSNLISSLIPFVLVSVVFFSATVLSRSDEEVVFNRLLERYNDYRHNGQYSFRPVEGVAPLDPARTYAVKEAIRSNMLGDRLAVNESFFARSGGSDWVGFLRGRLIGKMMELVKRMAHDYYLALGANVVLAVFCYQKLQSRTRRLLLLGSQGWMLLVLLMVGGFWKLPPRLAGPTVAVICTVTLVFYLRHRRLRLPKVPIWAWAILMGLFAYQIYMIGIRSLTLGGRQQANEAYFRSLKRRFRGQLLVGVNFEPYFNALSPWQQYNFGHNTLLMLTGWQTMTPEYRAYLAKLTGHEQFGDAVPALVARPKTIWIAPIGFNLRLNRLLHAVHGTQVVLLPFKTYVAGPANDELNEYFVGLPPGRTTPFGPLPGRVLPVESDSVLSTPAVLPKPAVRRLTPDEVIVPSGLR